MRRRALAALAAAALGGAAIALWGKGGRKDFEGVVGAREATVALGGPRGHLGPTRHAMLKVRNAMSEGTVVKIAAPGRLVVESERGITRSDIDAIVRAFGDETTIAAGGIRGV